MKLADSGVASTKTFEVTVTDGMTAEKIAEAIAKSVTDAADAALEASASQATVTISEKAGQEGNYFTGNGFTATFTKKA